MPIYEYQCRECSHRLEKIQKMSDAPLTRCPECGRDTLTKLVSAAGFRLKGGGWYETDFKKDGKRNLAADESSSKSGGGGSDSGAGEGGKDSGKKDSAASSGKSSSESSGKSSDASGKSGKSSSSGSATSSAA